MNSVLLTTRVFGFHLTVLLQNWLSKRRVLLLDWQNLSFVCCRTIIQQSVHVSRWKCRFQILCLAPTTAKAYPNGDATELPAAINMYVTAPCGSTDLFGASSDDTTTMLLLERFLGKSGKSIVSHHFGKPAFVTLLASVYTTLRIHTTTPHNVHICINIGFSCIGCESEAQVFTTLHMESPKSNPLACDGGIKEDKKLKFVTPN